MKRVILPIVILIVGFGLAGLIIATGPTLEQQAPPDNAPLVRVWNASPQTVQLKITAHGSVLPRTESDLVPEVAGRVTRISPNLVSGGFFKEGEVLLQIDPLDYELAVEQANAALASARSELASAERAHARQIDLAKRNLTSETQTDDALNRMRAAQARLKETRAGLQRARRDLARTQLTAPYDGRVRTETVDVGQFVSRGAPVAKLYATDLAEVRLPVPDDELAYLDLPLDGLHAETALRPKVLLHATFAGQRHTWQGEVVRTEGEIDPQTRMINVIAQVAQPYVTVGTRPPLAVGLFVEAEIMGEQVDQVYVLPRSAIQANNQVYVVNADNTLEFRDVDILRIVAEDVYITGGFRSGEKLSLSTVNNAIQGMRVRQSLDNSQTADNSTASGGRGAR